MTTEANNSPATTEREARLEAELARHSAELLNTPLYDIQGVEETGGPLCPLTSEAGYWSPKACLDEADLWDVTLREAIGYLVDDIYTSDGELYDSHGALAAALVQEPEDFVDPDELKPESVRVRFRREEPGEYRVEIHPEDEPYTTPGAVERALESLSVCRSMLRTEWLGRLYMRHTQDWRAPRGWRKIKDLQAEFSALSAAVKARQMPAAGTGRSKPRPRTNKTRRKK